MALRFAAGGIEHVELLHLACCTTISARVWRESRTRPAPRWLAWAVRRIGLQTPWRANREQLVAEPPDDVRG